MLLVYGAYGYTGELIARRALELGLRPILSGRDDVRLRALASELGLDQRTAALDDPSGLRDALRGVRCVLHCAGPFVHTATPMLDACLAARVHYLDITGEIPVFEAIAGRDQEARDAGITALPGAGFDVVPSDCLALHLKQRLPSASELRLAIRSSGRTSHGTATTMLEHATRGCQVRRAGKLEQLPLGSLRRDIDFGKGAVPALAIAWGDVASAWRTTGIPNIEVYWALPRRLRPLAPLLSPLVRLTRFEPVRNLAQRRIDRAGSGPTDAERARSSCVLWGEVVDPAGQRAAARLHTPDGYTLTAHAALHIAQKVLGGKTPTGFQTPASAFGKDLALELAGVRREDLTDCADVGHGPRS
jgi:short subunit dehydrogenase-like uncharacterized protein